jgi:hypothetical protein
MYILNVYEQPYYMCIQVLYYEYINGFGIMATLISVYFEYIQISCKIFVKYITPILRVYPNHLIIRLKIITNDIYFYCVIYI